MDNSNINLTIEQVTELIKCAKDPIYFIENYIWIEVKETSSIVPFRLYPYQKKVLQALVDGKNILALKSRRVGISTVCCAFAAWKVNFHRGVNVLFVSRSEREAKGLLDKVKFNLHNLAKHDSDEYNLATKANWMLNPLPYENQQEIHVGWYNDEGELESTGSIKSLTTTKEAGRGQSGTLVFIDEFAFLPDQDGVQRSLRLTALRGGQWMAASTPNGATGAFYTMCQLAERRENTSYEFVRIHWSEAEITAEMVHSATEGMAEASVNQEMEMEFISSGDPVFDPIHLSACYKPVEEYPEIAQALNEYRLDFTRNPYSNYYYSGVDSAVGKLNKKGGRRDYHSFTTLTKSGIQAFTYHSKTDSLTDWAGTLEATAAYGDVFKEGIVSKLHRDWPGFMQIEENGPGAAVMSNHQLPDDKFSAVRGVVTNAKTKGGLGGYINQLIMAIEAHAIVITDLFTYQCMQTFQRGTSPGQFAAPPGDYYDDPVISLALAYDALLREGRLEFPWGNTTDGVKIHKVVNSSNFAELDQAQAGFGPVTFNTTSGTSRLTDLMPDTLGDFNVGQLPVMVEDLPNSGGW